ncbi:anaerobic ribonucleoside-triphosphate reductase-activating protein [Photobacterium rosenbergii]|uniref:Anaerobic ribonucleoside-triphosphate reductase-activating protein n=1 Tax=Photobacterium rosenbergii TaxID=294936 RepID=A0ABU3ZJF0_9GAMM|nr:anaerobic ribonucleoside-triphosphate reductase-activating protein [Photobacterium rosenbergii]MDV5170256.1 anaerobic ribonucleoside-triphosphate reductase-activating protein [Photobacterium rosenbergii]
MNYHNYYPVDVVNGPGTRCTLFVSGCVHQCRGCYNQSTWRIDAGHVYTQEMEDQIIADLNDSRIKRRGLSLSGGDPLHPANVPAILQLVQRVHAECPGKDIWLWSGYRLEELDDQQKAVLEYVDVVVDGKFETELHDPELIWRGSSNQVIHYLKDPK